MREAHSFFRYCSDCGEKYHPTGKGEGKFCDKCLKKRKELATLHARQTRIKNKGIRAELVKIHTVRI